MTAAAGPSSCFIRRRLRTAVRESPHHRPAAGRDRRRPSGARDVRADAGNRDAPARSRRRRSPATSRSRASRSITPTARECCTTSDFTARPARWSRCGPHGRGEDDARQPDSPFYDTTAGRILIDGADVRNYRIRSLREKIAIVPAGPGPVQGTIATTCATGGSTPQRKRSKRPRARPMRTSSSAPGEGLPTRNRPGRRQPVRRLEATPAPQRSARHHQERAILILDEPTSSLDAISEEIVFAALRRLRAGRTTLVIAHRCPRFADADCILVLDAARSSRKGARGAAQEQPALPPHVRRLSVGKSLDDPETVDELIPGGQMMAIQPVLP